MVRGEPGVGPTVGTEGDGLRVTRDRKDVYPGDRNDGRRGSESHPFYFSSQLYPSQTPENELVSSVSFSSLIFKPDGGSKSSGSRRRTGPAAEVKMIALKEAHIIKSQVSVFSGR